MSINNIELVSILVYVLAGLFFLQTICTVIMFFAFKKILLKIEDRTISAVQRSAGQIRNFKAFLGRIDQSLEKLPVLENSITKVLDYAIGKFQIADQYAESTLKKSAMQIEEAGRKVDVSLKQLSRHTDQVDRAIRNPAVNVSALLQGLVVGFRELFKTTQAIQPATHSPEDDAFI
jgi:Na+/H+ antiporter NhaB